MDKKPAIYIHIPFCKRKCNYCAFVSVCDQNKQKEYISALLSEIEKKANGAEVSTIYIGGGTPSVLYRGAITQIADCIKKNYKIAKDYEFTVEANPDSVTDEFCRECKSVGVNRVSLGIQSTCNEILHTLGRIHDNTAHIRAIERLKNSGIDNVSGDLIIGVDGQTVEQVRKDVKNLIALSLSHISVYSLSIEEGTPFYKNGVTVNEDLQADMYDEVYNILKDNGYYRYEVSNFAKKGFESRHNGKYWRGVVYYGFGVSAHSLLDGYIRAENTNSLDEYLSGVTTVNSYFLDIAERKEEAIMLNLRTVDGIDLDKFNKEFGANLLDEKKQEIDKLEKSGVIKIENGKLFATEKGFYVLDSIITELM